MDFLCVQFQFTTKQQNRKNKLEQLLLSQKASHHNDERPLYMYSLNTMLF